jgi:hypothetical protein
MTGEAATPTSAAMREVLRDVLAEVDAYEVGRALGYIPYSDIVDMIKDVAARAGVDLLGGRPDAGVADATGLPVCRLIVYVLARSMTDFDFHRWCQVWGLKSRRSVQG